MKAYTPFYKSNRNKVIWIYVDRQEDDEFLDRLDKAGYKQRV